LYILQPGCKHKITGAVPIIAIQAEVVEYHGQFPGRVSCLPSASMKGLQAYYPKRFEKHFSCHCCFRQGPGKKTCHGRIKSKKQLIILVDHVIGFGINIIKVITVAAYASAAITGHLVDVVRLRLR
jgi:hypothetical protein